MSRQATVIDRLEQLKQAGAIDDYTRDTYPNEPARIKWVIQTGPVDRLYYATPQVEAFIEGALTVLRRRA